MDKKFSFNEVTYEYCQKDPLFSNYTLEELTGKVPTACSHTDDPVSRFENARADLTKDFSDILRIFSMDGFRDDFKVNNQYCFSKTDLIFVVELIRRYRTSYIWKKEIKKILNYPLDKRNFIVRFQNSKSPSDFAVELNFAVEGFLVMHDSLEHISEESKKAFKKALQISTQYMTINLIQNFFKKIVYIGSLYPTSEEVNHSINGVLLNDYNQWLEEVTKKLENFIDDNAKEWTQQKDVRMHEFDQWLDQNPPVKLRIISDCIEHMRQFIQENYPGYRLDDNLDVSFDKSDNKTCQKARIETSKEREILEKALKNEYHEHPKELTLLLQFYHMI